MGSRKLDRSLSPPKVGNIPVMLSPKAKHSDILCDDCYYECRKLFSDLELHPPNSVPSHGTGAIPEFIGDNSKLGWCQRVIVSIPLLIALISFFVGVIEKLGDEVFYDIKMVDDGVWGLTLNIGGKVFEWATSTYVINPGNHRKEYSIHVFIANSIDLAGNRVTALLRFLDLVGILHQTKAAIHARNERQLKPAIDKYFSIMMAKVKAICVALKTLNPQEDEQHSRETRKRGQEPYCTAEIIESFSRLVTCRSHVQKKDYPGKALANISPRLS